MKSKFLLIPVLLGMLALSGCGSTSSQQEAEPTPEPEEETVIIYVTATPTPTSTVTPTNTTSPTPVPVFIKSEVEPEYTWQELFSAMGAGWNMGNTMDASNCGGGDLGYETAWVDAPLTTPELFTFLKEAGFNTVRIPVSWHNHISVNIREDRSREYVISEKWLKRVHEIVDYAYDQGFFVIINIHHDDHTEYYVYPDEKRKDSSIDYLKSIWGQLAKEFGDYDEHLIFETFNEVRVKGNNEWNASSGEAQKAQREYMNLFNQVAVDTIRSTEGKYNAIRFIGCPGYAAAIDSIRSYELPEDHGGYEGRLLYAVHSYIPYNFTTGTQNTFSSSTENEIKKYMERIQKEVLNKGIPVYIGEWGVSNQDANYSARLKYVSYFLGYAANNFKDKDGNHVYIPCIVWDNTTRQKGSKDAFGIVNRWTNTAYEPAYLKKLIESSKDLTIKENESK